MTAPAPDERPAFPSLQARQNAMLALVPRVDGGPGLLPLVGRELRWTWTEEVAPLIDEVAPELRTGAFGGKLEAGFGMYFGLALCALLFSSRRPASVRRASSMARTLALDEHALLRLSVPLFPVLFRGLHRRRMRRAAWMSTFILAVDQGMDEGLSHVPLADRPRALAAALDETQRTPADACLRLARVLVSRCRRSVRDHADRRELDELMVEIHGWAKRETFTRVGAGDATGFEHRRFGIDLSMDLLIWALRPHALTAERAWMISVAELGQVVDDWLDLDEDAAAGLATPATSGLWDATTAARALRDVEARLKALADASGEPDGAWRRLIERTWKGQARTIVKLLIAHPLAERSRPTSSRAASAARCSCGRT